MAVVITYQPVRTWTNFIIHTEGPVCAEIILMKCIYCLWKWCQHLILVFQENPMELTLGSVVCVFLQVFNNHFFQVTIDDLRAEPSNLSMLCHADSLGILPVQWCLKNGVNLSPPKGSYSVKICSVRVVCGGQGGASYCQQSVALLISRS